MGIAGYLKEIGRGAAGARSLSADAAEALMGAVLDGEASDLEIGAFALAMRMKGETLDELVGFLAAAQARLTSFHADGPVVVIPSYNGARRLPNLTPLLAMTLAQEGARVLVHGVGHDPARVTTATIFHDLGMPVAQDEGDVHAFWARHEPAYLATATLSPALQRLLDVRWSVGLRNSGHTIAKMLNPCTGARVLRLASFTHPEFGALLGAWAQRERVDVMLLRGTEGEAAADPRRQPRMETWIGGQLRSEWSLPAHEGVVTELPVLPREIDAATTALYIQSVLSGEKPAPAPLARQVACILGALDELQEPRLAREAAGA
ncbi:MULTISPECIES: DNA-binding protein YbiB [unclassified Rubrivivax]|uniref:DNA-binding protein YbiB n=1 Tax=unclassified Rubrivivax TaxID=2649762 RepID=UPI001E4E71CA|nr:MULTISPECIES: DNA-binding protein YbiB [unclassified Rubrivivax]MCC9596022.1 DNA-binding protein YbiB [Rubrivivax sp. JA1055]MCC9647637.1 DNA-binding protein YbiB [Rubrivivax sp. JA1029]